MCSLSWARNRPLAPPSMMRWSKVADTVMVGTSTGAPPTRRTTGRAIPKAAIMLVPDASMGVPASTPSAPTLLTLDTYGGAGVQTAGLAGWALAQAFIARDLLMEAGGADATDESVLTALSTYSSTDLPAYPDVICPGPEPWLGACNTSPLMVTVVDGQMTGPDGFTFLDFSQLNFLLG